MATVMHFLVFSVILPLRDYFLLGQFWKISGTRMTETNYKL